MMRGANDLRNAKYEIEELVCPITSSVVRISIDIVCSAASSAS